MTRRYLPASMSSLRRRTSLSFVSPDLEHDLPCRTTGWRNKSGKSQRPVRRDVEPARNERGPRDRRKECLPTASRTTSYVSPVLREVLLLVVDDLVRASERPELDVLRVADRGDVRPEVGGRVVPRPFRMIPTRRRREGAVRDHFVRSTTTAGGPGSSRRIGPCGLLEGHTGRDRGERAGSRTETYSAWEPLRETEDPVSDRKVA